VGAAPRILVVAGDAVEAAACELALEAGLPGSAVAIERSAVAGLSAARTGASPAGSSSPHTRRWERWPACSNARRTRADADGDVITGLPGERRFLAALEAESERAQRQKPPVALLLLEVDRLDRVRDRFGDEVVHAILREAVAGSVRSYDLAARVGPQGFGVLLPGADRAEAEVVAQRIRAGVAAIEFPAMGRVTVSLGLAAFPEAVDAVPSLLEAAEQALLIGRRSGDVVVAAPARETDEPPAGRW
jgi:diguanylate cyclase (GGDEF)-like protein